jgi:hypothetical protein
MKFIGETQLNYLYLTDNFLCEGINEMILNDVGQVVQQCWNEQSYLTVFNQQCDKLSVFRHWHSI